MTMNFYENETITMILIDEMDSAADENGLQKIPIENTFRKWVIQRSLKSFCGFQRRNG